MGYIIQYRDGEQETSHVSWNNKEYAEYRDAAVAAIEARDSHRGPGRSWTVSHVTRMETFR